MRIGRRLEVRQCRQAPSAHARSSRTGAAVQLSHLAGYTILVVEDEPLIAAEIIASFEAVGAVVLAASSLDRARPLLEHPDLSAAVLDFGFHDGDANSLCARLNERDIPYVLHSGYAHLSGECGRGVVVGKPASPGALFDAVARLLGDRHGPSASALPLDSDDVRS